jgi:hypothetical protein
MKLDLGLLQKGKDVVVIRTVKLQRLKHALIMAEAGLYT